MRKSKKIKRELHNFWLKQLDQHEESGADRQKEKSPQEFSPLAADMLFQRQLQRLKTQRAGNPTANGSGQNGLRDNFTLRQPT